MIDLFWDAEEGGVFATGTTPSNLIARPRTSSTTRPLGQQPGRRSAGDAGGGHRRPAPRRAGRGHRPRLPESLAEQCPIGRGPPAGRAGFVSKQRELAIVGDPADARTRALMAVATSGSAPRCSWRSGDPATEPSVPLLADRSTAADGAPQAYLCTGFVCACAHRPTRGPPLRTISA